MDEAIFTEAIFTCYLGNGEFDYITLPASQTRHATEIGDAIDHFEAKYPNRSWRLYPNGMEDMEPLFTYSPSQQRNETTAWKSMRQDLMEVF